MLPASARLTTRSDFALLVRTDVRRVRRPLLTLAVRLPSARAGGRPAARVGFAVSRRVGNAVQRNRVKRRLRALMRTRLAALPAGSLVLVRASPSAGQADYAALGVDLDAALQRALVSGRSG